MNDIAKSKFGSGGLRQRVEANEIKPLGTRVLVSNMQFGETKTRGGLILLDDDGKDHGIRPRWCQVYAVGPKQEDVKIGQWLLVAHGRWSRALEVKKDNDLVDVRMIDEKDILLISDEIPNDIK